jgi:AraC-like DNA-binding protein/mannose-6-phosphate isomerase-like protein (cupin superfamily)
MRPPFIDIDHIAIKLEVGELLLNVLFFKYGYFHESVREHSHSRGSYELHYIPAGKGTLIADGERYPLTPGTLFVTGPHIVHEQIPDADDPMAEYCVFFEALPIETRPNEGKRRSRKEAALSDLLIATPFWIGTDKENLLALFDMLAHELSAKRIGFYHMATNLLEMIVTRTIRQYAEHGPSRLHAPVKTMDDSRLLTIENCFLYEYRSLTLKQLADKIGLSTRQTERTVRKQYGLSFKDKRQQSRMSDAARLLLSTDLPVSAVAANIGFATLEHFGRSFKQYYGVTASQYRSREKR